MVMSTKCSRVMLVTFVALGMATASMAAVVPVGNERVLGSVAGALQPKQMARAGTRFAVVHEETVEDRTRIVLRYLEALSDKGSDALELAPDGHTPRLAAFADGSVVVAWTDYHSWFARFVDAQGNPSTEAVELDGVDGAFVRIAAGAGDDWVLVFQRYVEDGGTWQSVGFRFDGTVARSEQPFPIAALGWDTLVAMNAQGSFVASWTVSIEDEFCSECGDCCFDPSYTLVWGRGFDADASAVGEAQPLGGDFVDDEQGQNGHALVAVGNDGFAGAWLDYIQADYDPPGYLAFRLLDSTGVPSSKSRVIAEMAREAHGLSLALASGQAVFAVAQEVPTDGGGGLDVELYSTAVSGGSVEKLALATPDADMDFAPELAANDTGALLLAWERSVGQSPVREIVVRPFRVVAALVCGDSNFDGRWTATDALGILRAAVGSRFCAAAVCDANGDGLATASDAVLILHRSVGHDSALQCPASGVDVPAPFPDPWW